MRYAMIETVSFTGADGRTLPVKDLREIPAYEVAVVVPRGELEDVDDTASRREAYGEGAEGEAYRLWEANAAEIADAGYDPSGLRMMKVPLR